MDLILLDWTRMGTSFCLAGAVLEPDGVRIVRPLLARNRELPLRNVGWGPWLFEGHARWEVFEVVGPEPAEDEPPHLEDLWVRGLRPRNSSATPGQRRAILQATADAAAEDLFGAPLTKTHAGACAAPGQGHRSLATLVVPAGRIHFSAALREGAPGPDVRVRLGTPPVEDRLLPVKDHHLLLRAERAGPDPEAQTRALDQTVRQMGGQVAVRLGLSRAFGTRPGEGHPVCWVMADGFFSLADPQG
jgi:hypothetical protein